MSEMDVRQMIPFTRNNKHLIDSATPVYIQYY